MKNLAKKLSAFGLCTVFAMMQVSATTIMTGDTGLGIGNGGAVINNATGGYLGTDLSAGSASLNFNGDSHVNWDSLNVNRGETLNFNAVNGANNLTVVNTVNTGMTNVYGEINSNQGIGKLIISNPNGMLFDGAKFTTAGDLELTTQALGVNYGANGNINVEGLNQEAVNGIVIKDGSSFASNFNIGGEFNIIAPLVEMVGGYVGASKGVNLVTKDGQNYLLAPTASNDVNNKAVRLESVMVDGNVYIVSGEGFVTTVNGGTINGDLKVDSKGNIGLNYTNNGNTLNITGDLKTVADDRVNIVRKAKVGGNLDMSNSGGYVEILDTEVAGNANLKTTTVSNNDLKHFIHVIGDSKVGGDLNIDSAHNIHIGGYDDGLKALLPGSLNVGGNLNAVARDGSVAVTIDTNADKVSLTSETLNILTDGKATISANDYEFVAKHYIGGLQDSNYLIKTVMENYTPIGQYIQGDGGLLNISGGNINKLEQNRDCFTFIKSNGDLNVDNVNAGKVYLTSNKDIVIKDNATADLIKVGGATRNLTVKLPNRDYKLQYTNIKDSNIITVDKDTEITFDMANGDNGWNKGVQTDKNTYLVVPGAPANPIINPEDPTMDDAEKILRNLSKDQVATAIDAQQVMTPVAFAADLDDEIDTGVRKNVDGSVTVVRPYTPSK